MLFITSQNQRRGTHLFFFSTWKSDDRHESKLTHVINILVGRVDLPTNQPIYQLYQPFHQSTKEPVSSFPTGTCGNRGEAASGASQRLCGSRLSTWKPSTDSINFGYIGYSQLAFLQNQQMGTAERGKHGYHKTIYYSINSDNTPTPPRTDFPSRGFLQKAMGVQITKKADLDRSRRHIFPGDAP